jgi:hypothetical protein
MLAKKNLGVEIFLLGRIKIKSEDKVLLMSIYKLRFDENITQGRTIPVSYHEQLKMTEKNIKCYCFSQC